VKITITIDTDKPGFPASGQRKLTRVAEILEAQAQFLRIESSEVEHILRIGINLQAEPSDSHSRLYCGKIKGKGDL
jgi:hypothetical protein